MAAQATLERRERFRLGSWVLPTYTHLVIVWLFAPIVVMVIFAFNDTHGKLNIQWVGFTGRWFLHPFAIPTLTKAVETSLLSATVSMIIATTATPSRAAPSSTPSWS